MTLISNPYRGRRKGSLYCEVTNAGHRYARGAGCVDRYFKTRWVAEWNYYGRRFRFRSTSEANCRAWLADMAVRYND